MDEPDDRLLGIIERAVSYEAVDWASMIALAESEEERVWIQNLREIFRIANHRRNPWATPRRPAREGLIPTPATLPAVPSQSQTPPSATLSQPPKDDRDG